MRSRRPAVCVQRRPPPGRRIDPKTAARVRLTESQTRRKTSAISSLACGMSIRNGRISLSDVVVASLMPRRYRSLWSDRVRVGCRLKLLEAAGGRFDRRGPRTAPGGVSDHALERARTPPRSDSRNVRRVRQRLPIAPRPASPGIQGRAESRSGVRWRNAGEQQSSPTIAQHGKR